MLAIMQVQYVLMNINTKVILVCCAATSWPSSWVTKHIILERNFWVCLVQKIIFCAVNTAWPVCIKAVTLDAINFG